MRCPGLRSSGARVAVPLPRRHRPACLERCSADKACSQASPTVTAADTAGTSQNHFSITFGDPVCRPARMPIHFALSSQPAIWAEMKMRDPTRIAFTRTPRMSVAKARTAICQVSSRYLV